MANSLISSMINEFETTKKEKEMPKDSSSFLLDWLKNNSSEHKKKEIATQGTQRTQEAGQAAHCSPLLADVGVGVVVQGPVTLAFGFDACPMCGSSWITEWPDQHGGVYMRCWSCRGHIDHAVLAERVRINVASSQGQRRLLPWAT